MPNSPFADVTAAQFDVLLAIGQADTPTQAAVIDAYQTRRATTSRPNDYLSALVQRGYVAVDESSGRMRYQLTDDGRNALRTLRDEIDAALGEYDA